LGYSRCCHVFLAGNCALRHHENVSGNLLQNHEISLGSAESRATWT
jgi:hypothetical protein